MKIQNSFLKNSNRQLNTTFAFLCFCLKNPSVRINAQLDTTLGSRGPSGSLRRATSHNQLFHYDREVFYKLEETIK